MAVAKHKPPKWPDLAKKNPGSPELTSLIPDLTHSMETIVNNTVFIIYLMFPRRVDLKYPHHTHTNGNYEVIDG